jgi:hypothetical protein
VSAEAVRIKDKRNLLIEADPAAPEGSVLLGSASQACGKGDAVQIEASRAITLRRLTIANAGGQSITLISGDKNHNESVRLERNRIFSNGAGQCAGGILIGPHNTDTLIVNNLIYGNGKDGVRFFGAKGGPHYVVQNTIHANRWNGVDVAQGHTVVLLNNIITHNGTDPQPPAHLYGVRRPAPTTTTNVEKVRLLHNLICGNTEGELSGRTLDALDVGNLTPTGAEGPGVSASPQCAEIATVFANANGVDGAPASQFASMGGDLLVTQELPGILWRVRWTGAAFETTELARVSQWEHVTFSTAGIVEIAPTSDSFTYKANDGSLDSNVATVQLTIVPPNHPPAITTSPITQAIEGQLYSYEVEASDPDTGDVLTYALSTAPVHHQAEGQIHHRRDQRSAENRRSQWQHHRCDAERLGEFHRRGIDVRA